MRARRITMFWVKLAAFLCLLAMMCNSVGLVLSGDTDTSRNSTALKHLPRDSVDLLWMGSSHIYNGVVPQMLYDEHGITSAMLSMQNMSVGQMYWGLREVLRRQSPKVVVMDLYTAAAPYCYGNEPNTMALKRVCPNTHINNQAGQMARWLPLGSPYKPFAMWEANQRYGIALSEMFEITKLHDRYGLLRQNSFLSARAHSGLTLDFGAYFGNTVTNPDMIQYEDYTQDAAVEAERRLWQFTEEQLEQVSLQPDTLRDIERIIRLTRERGIQLVFCVVPYITNAAENKIFQQIAQLAQEEGVAFFGADAIQLTYDQFSEDLGHLNSEGAQEYTAFMGEELSRRFDLPDRRQSADRRYAAWRDHTGRYLTQIAVRSKYDTMSEYLEMLTTLDDDYDIFLNFQGPVYERFTEDDYWLLVEELGIPEDVLAQWYDTGEGSLKVLVHNKQTLASSYSMGGGEEEPLWSAFRDEQSDKDGLYVKVVSFSYSRSVSQVYFDLTQVGE